MNLPAKRKSALKTKKNKTEQEQTASNRKQDKKKKKEAFHQIIFRDWCKSCGICAAFCPQNVIGRDESGAPVVEHPDACIGCRFCELHCPDFAITIKEHNTDVRRNAS